MLIHETLQYIEKTNSFAELQSAQILPEPYDDNGFYLIYYAKEDYMPALCDIVRFANDDMRIYYDRYLETGAAHERDFIAKANNLHCRCVVFYLSEHVFHDSVFAGLCYTVQNNHLPYLSINIPVNGEVLSGARLAKKAQLDQQLAQTVESLFSDQITYVPQETPYADKKIELSRAYKQSAMHYSIHGDFAIAEYVKDLAEEEISIPASVEIQGKSYPVRAIGAHAFAGCRQLKRISFPDTIEDIGFGYSNVSSVGVFYNCKSLKEIIYPPHVKTLYGGMFIGCSSLKRLLLNDSLTFEGIPDISHFSTASTIEHGASSANAQDDQDKVPISCVIEELHLPDCVQMVQNDAVIDQFVRFLYHTDGEWIDAIVKADKCTGGSRIETDTQMKIDTVPLHYANSRSNTPEKIVYPKDWYFADTWKNSFTYCTNLKWVRLPDTIKCLDGCFIQCPNLKHVVLPSSLQAIVRLSFTDCPSISELHFPEYLYEIDSSCFRGGHIHTIVSDCIYSKRLFQKSAHIPYEYISTPNATLRWVQVLTHIVFNLSEVMQNRKKTPFYLWSRTEVIYITKQVKPFQIEGFTLVDSDREGYHKYECHWGFGGRLKQMRKEVKRY